MIRYDREYNQEITRVVSNFNRKVRRLEQQEARLLPTPVKVSDIKERFSNRRELNKYLNDLRRFSRRGAEDIVEVKGKEYTRYQIDLFRTNLRRERDRVRRELARDIQAKNPYPMQHNVHMQNLRNRQERLTQAWTQLIDKEFSRIADKYIQDSETFDNYLEILFRDAYQVGFDKEKLEHIREKLSELSTSQFIHVLETTPEIQYVFEYYHSLTRQAGVTNIGVYNAFRTLERRIDDIVDTELGKK